MATEQARQAPTQGQDQKDPFAGMNGTFDDPRYINKVLGWASQAAHLVSPASACGILPAGCAASITVVWLNPKDDAHSVGAGKFGLLKNALNRIANAAGVCWDTHASGRCDDGSDPRFVWWKSIGAWRDLGLGLLPIVGDKQMDLRDGSAQVERIFANARDKATGTKQLMEMRSFILEHAQSKAELRGIRKGLGIRSYTEGDFNKPWVVVKLMFTGQSNDPQIARDNAAAIRHVALGGAQAMFGPPPKELQAHAHPGAATPAALPQAPPTPRRLPAPPVGASRDDDDDFDPPQQTRQASPPPSEPRSKTATGGGDAAQSGFQVPGGRDKGKDLVDADDSSLTYWSKRIGDGLDAGTSKYADRDRALLVAMRLEIARRDGSGAPPAEKPPRAAAAPPPPQPNDESDIPFGGPDDRGDSPDGY